MAGMLSREAARTVTTDVFAQLGRLWNVEEPFTPVMISSSSARSFPASNICFSSQSGLGKCGGYGEMKFHELSSTSVSEKGTGLNICDFMDDRFRRAIVAICRNASSLRVTNEH